jgi:serine/threonine protein phosphatase PrpC
MESREYRQLVALERSLAYPLTFVKHSIASDRHPGRNEDSLVVDRQQSLVAVFDGVGASKGGEIASQIAAQVIRKGWKRAFRTMQPGRNISHILEYGERHDLRSLLLSLVEDAHSSIRAAETQQAERAGSEDQATTVALAIFHRQPQALAYTMVYLWVGDSRVYLLRKGQKLSCLTRDDSYLTKLVQDDILTEEDALRIDQAERASDLSEAELACFHKRNGITQALGGAHPVTVHLDQTTIMPGDRILLCTDGVHDNLTDNQIEDIMRTAPRTAMARLLVESAARGSRQEKADALRAKPDDITALVVTALDLA